MTRLETIDEREAAKIRVTRDRADAKHRREEEVSLAAAIQRAEPNMSRSDALREAARIVTKNWNRP